MFTPVGGTTHRNQSDVPSQRPRNFNELSERIRSDGDGGSHEPDCPRRQDPCADVNHRVQGIDIFHREAGKPGNPTILML
jgi:hypothetical protein